MPRFGYHIDYVTIANGASVSSAVELGDDALCGIEIPAAWTAASIALEVAAPAASLVWVPLFSSTGTRLIYSAAASRRVVLPASDLIALGHVRLVSVDASAVAVLQAADRSIAIFRRAFG